MRAWINDMSESYLRNIKVVNERSGKHNIENNETRHTGSITEDYIERN
jgi:hypothetical protein